MAKSAVEQAFDDLFNDVEANRKYYGNIKKKILILKEAVSKVDAEGYFCTYEYNGVRNKLHIGIVDEWIARCDAQDKKTDWKQLMEIANIVYRDLNETK